MHKIAPIALLVGTLLIAGARCDRARKEANNGKPADTSNVPTASSSHSPAAKPATPKSVGSSEITAQNNPTTRAGRGEPSLDDKDRPAAWVYIDGLEGEFRAEGGIKLLQWFIDGPVSPSPKMRVEVFEPLLGVPTDFQCVVSTNKSDDGSAVVYAIKAHDGTFEVGKEYSLLNPGPNFTIVNKMTGETMTEIPPLPSGQYGMLASVKNSQTNKEALAVTYFTVGRN